MCGIMHIYNSIQNTYANDMYGPTIRKSVLGVTKVGTSSFPNIKTFCVYKIN